ncbi:MAG: hypothetical protein IKW62_06040 [Clostridia bacterium]|nr:hypothetical protein [Clostridia bacterium]
MKFSIKNLKGAKVYFWGKDQPWGVFSDVMMNKNGRIEAYIVKTLSIVPISKVIQNRDIDKIEDGKIVLKKGMRLVNYELFRKAYTDNTIKSENVKKVVLGGMKPKKLKDMRFDLETGEICDVVISQNIIAGKYRLSVNKISATDNTIYI